MPELRPFPALRYSVAAGPLADLLAPPYDVIDEAAAAELLRRSEWNAVRLVLPEGMAPGRYALAADRLVRWSADGILALDAGPTVSVYRQEFEAPEGPLVRHALFAALTLEPFGEGSVLPHERTHAGPKQDRLALTLATRTQLSPVFLVARDERGALLAALRDAARAGAAGATETRAESAVPPVARARTPDGVGHELLTVADPAAAGALCAAAGAGPLLIADGHHRYETALEVMRRIGENEPRARSVLACVVSALDPGLIIRPTHRVLHGPPPGGAGTRWIERLAVSFALEPLPEPDPADAEALAARSESIVVVTGGQAFRLAPRPAALLRLELDEAGKDVPPVLLERLVVEDILGSDADGAAGAGLLSYHRDAAEACEAAGAAGAAFLLPSVSLDAVWRVTGLGRRLPPKSTYFEPKVPSGLLFRPLAGA